MPTRRELLKGMTGFAVASTLRAAGVAFVQPPQNNQLKFNIVLHGLYVMNFTNSNIQLLAPFVEAHRYYAGIWDRNALINLEDSNDRTKRMSYSLAGVDSRPFPDLRQLACGPVLSQAEHRFQVKPQNAHIEIDLPFPEQIRLLRCWKPKPPNDTIFQGAPMDGVKQVSLCQVLIYSVSDISQVPRLIGTDWHVDVKQSRQIPNLHLWAEPEEQTLPSHAVEAFQSLMKLIPPLNFTIINDGTQELDNDTGVPGVAYYEEEGLSEWFHGGEGSHGSDCECFMVTA